MSFFISIAEFMTTKLNYKGVSGSLRVYQHYWRCARVCVDVDECARPDRGGCSHECVNTQGSYECVCPPGYRVIDDHKTCRGLLSIVMLTGLLRCSCRLLNLDDKVELIKRCTQVDLCRCYAEAAQTTHVFGPDERQLNLTLSYIYFLPCDYAKHIRTVLLSTSVCPSDRLSVCPSVCQTRVL